MKNLWEKLKHSPGMLAAAIFLVVIVLYLAIKNSQGQTGNPQGTQGAGINPQTGLPYGQSSTQGGYYLLSEEDVPGPINVSIGNTTQPTGHPGPPGPPGPRGPRGRPGPRPHDQAVHVGRHGPSHRHVGTNPNVIKRSAIPLHEHSDAWFGQPRPHVTHIVSPVPLGIHPPAGHGQRPVKAPTPISTKQVAPHTLPHPLGIHTGPAHP